MSTSVQDLPSGGTAAVNDYFVGEHTPGTTVKLTYAPTLSMDPTPGLAANLTLNGHNVGTATSTEVGYLSGVTSAIQTQLNGKVATSSLGTNVATFLATPTSANLAAALTNETGTGSAVFATSPTLVTPLLGTPTSGNLSNCTGYTASNLGGLGTGVGTFLATPTSANLAAALTDETGTGAAVFASSPALLTPTATGVTNASSAAAGIVGEILASSWVTTGSLTSAVAANVTSLALTAGDWDLWGVGTTAPAGATTTGFAFFAINTTSATVPPASSIASSSLFAGGTAVAGQPMAGQVPVMRITISGTTTYYLNTVINFAVNTMAAAGYIIARRRR